MSQRTFEAWHGGVIFSDGLGNVVICRHKPSGDTEAGIFLVDMYCLGVKDATYWAFPTSSLNERLDEIFGEQGRVPIRPACARKLLEDALAYARNLGFGPHPDYKKAARVLGGLDSGECETSFTFGREGKPFYISGPNDSEQFQRVVVSSLHARLGAGNYHYLLGGPDVEVEETRLPEHSADEPS